MRIFISYSHRDSDARDRLQTHLAGLEREGIVKTWYDRKILAGNKIDDKIKSKLEAADLFLLLVSPDFIASDYCFEQEMQRALKRHDEGAARVVPIIVEPCDWASIPSLRQLKAIPTDGKPISLWPNTNSAYLDVVQELRRIIGDKETSAAAPSAPEPAPNAMNPDIPEYRIQRTFDEIQRSVFRQTAFETMKTYFRLKVEEIESIEGLRGRFTDRDANSFGGMIINSGLQHQTAHITVHCRNGNSALWDIYYSNSENSPEGTANGGFSVSSDEYELFLTATAMVFENPPERLTPEQAAEYLWKQFIKNAGITHA